MADTQITDPAPSDPDPSQDCKVCETWQQVIQGVLGGVLLLGAVIMVRHYGPSAAQSPPPEDLQKEVHELTAQVEQLKQDQAMPAVVLNRYRDSIGYIYGIYQVGFPNHHPEIRARVSGTGFLVGNGLLATNRHVAEPWYGDSEAQKLIDEGASAILSRISYRGAIVAGSRVTNFRSRRAARGRFQFCSEPARVASGQVSRSPRPTGYGHRLPHGDRGDGGKIPHRNLRTPGVPPQ